MTKKTFLQNVIRKNEADAHCFATHRKSDDRCSSYRYVVKNRNPNKLNSVVNNLAQICKWISVHRNTRISPEQHVA